MIWFGLSITGYCFFFIYILVLKNVNTLRYPWLMGRYVKVAREVLSFKVGFSSDTSYYIIIFYSLPNDI